MTWRVTVTREQQQTDGQGAYQRTWATRVVWRTTVFDDPDTAEHDARAYAGRVLAGRTDPTVEVHIEGPPAPGATDVHLDESTRATGRAGLRRARAALGGA